MEGIRPLPTLADRHFAHNGGAYGFAVGQLGLGPGKFSLKCNQFPDFPNYMQKPQKSASF